MASTTWIGPKAPRKCRKTGLEDPQVPRLTSRSPIRTRPSESTPQDLTPCSARPIWSSLPNTRSSQKSPLQTGADAYRSTSRSPTPNPTSTVPETKDKTADAVPTPSIRQQHEDSDLDLRYVLISYGTARSWRFRHDTRDFEFAKNSNSRSSAS